MTHFSHSGNSVPLKPDSGIAQGSQFYPIPYCAVPNSYSHGTQGSHTHKEQEIHFQPYKPAPSTERAKVYQSQMPVGASFR